MRKKKYKYSDIRSEAVKIMEEYLGRELKSEEIVHHINLDANDNRIENLRVFPNASEHMKFHWSLPSYRKNHLWKNCKGKIISIKNSEKIPHTLALHDKLKDRFPEVWDWKYLQIARCPECQRIFLSSTERKFCCKYMRKDTKRFSSIVEGG